MKRTSTKPKPRSVKSSPLTVKRKYTLKKEIASREIEGQLLVLAPRTEFLYTLNASGKLLWAALKRGASQKRLAAMLVATYDLPLAIAEQDVAAFLKTLLAKGIIAAQ